jgi:hypothetical protein
VNTQPYIYKKKENEEEGNFRDKNRGQTKNLTLFSLLKKATVAAPVLGQKQANNLAPPPF